VYFGGFADDNLNKTVGWQWDLSNFNLIIKRYVWVGFLIGYGILLLLKRDTHKKRSLLHILLIFSYVVLEELLPTKSAFILIAYALSILFFGVNFIWAIKNKSATT
jgi:hypothetical protein